MSHYQLFPLDSPGPAGVHLEYVKEKEAYRGKMGAQPDEETDVKGHQRWQDQEQWDKMKNDWVRIGKS